MAGTFDKKHLFEWLKDSAYKAHCTLEKGAQKTAEFTQAVNEKIEASPRAKAVRDRLNVIVTEQSQRVQDVRIHGTRIGDLPNMAQKAAERQFFKMLMKLREADPDMNWGDFMPNPEEMPIFEAFETLGLPYGTPFEEVKRVYRRLMRENHPDKHSGSPEEEKQATQKTQELTAAYELICDHYGKK